MSLSGSEFVYSHFRYPGVTYWILIGIVPAPQPWEMWTCTPPLPVPGAGPGPMWGCLVGGGWGSKNRTAKENRYWPFRRTIAELIQKINYPICVFSCIIGVF